MLRRPRGRHADESGSRRLGDDADANNEREVESVKKISRLREGEVFVFGSNSAGAHGAGAARTAWKKFGAVWGEGHGHHGSSYAIDTMSGLSELSAEIERFCDYARTRPDLSFLVTEIGCGIAGYSAEQVAPLFSSAPDNVKLPASFVRLSAERD